MLLLTATQLIVALVALVTAFNTGEGWSDPSLMGPDLSRDQLSGYLRDHISPDQLRANLRHLTSQPHVAGTPAELNSARWVRDTWRKQGLDEARLTPYNVLLSYPDDNVPNKVVLKDAASGAVLAQSQPRQPPRSAPEEERGDVFSSFNAYSAQGTVEGSVVYVHYGSKEDYEFLDGAGVSLQGRIVLARYGTIFRANIARAAEQRGAAGLIFYTDPEDFAPDGPDAVYAETIMMPETGTQMGTVKLQDGDPLTVFYPSVESAYRVPEEEAPIPHIPITPVSYEDAYFIVRTLGGPLAPQTWQGSLNLTYHLGPTSPEYRVGLTVGTKNKRVDMHNVIGVLRGREEPDRYVLLGSHRDAWIFGAIDPSSAQSALIELTRVLTTLHKETGWRPRRTLVFCSWAASEYGLMGSMEWTEQFNKQLGDRAVAYLNIDLALIGNHSLTALGSPMLYDTLFEAAKRVGNPDPEEVRAGRPSVYDTWLYRDPEPSDNTRPFMYLVGAGSDYAPFLHTAGVPCLDFFYHHDKSAKNWYPLYHSLYETFDLVESLYDPGFKYQQTVATLWGEVALLLSEAQVLPYSLYRYSRLIDDQQQQIEQNFGDLLRSNGRSLDFFLEAGEVFSSTAKNFQEHLTTLDNNNPLAVRHVNDQLMMVERAFIDPRGLSDRPHYKHVILSPSPNDAYTGVAFHNLVSTLQTLSTNTGRTTEIKQLWKTLDQNLAIVTHLLHTAAAVMTDDLWWGPEEGQGELFVQEQQNPRDNAKRKQNSVHTDEL